MTKNKPLISVVMPVFNTERYVHRAIESILHQTLKNFEFIILNDGSTDNTFKIIKTYKKKDKRIRLINNQRNLRIAQTLNKAISYARTDLIARMDADDIAHLKRLEVQYLYLKRHPEVAIVGTNISIINEGEEEIWKREYPTKSKDLKKIMFRYSPFAHPSVMFRKKVFDEVGGYNPKMVPCEDIDLWFKIGAKYNFGNIPKTLLKYTLFKSSGSHYSLQSTELLGLKIKIKAITSYGFKPGVYDVFFNLLQFLSLWFMPASFRIRLYNELRSRNCI